MNLKKLSPREQLLTFVTAAVLVLGAYGLLRFYPLYQDIVGLNKDIQSMTKALRTGSIPSLPNREIGDLKAELAQVEEQLADARMMMGEVNRRLSGGDTTAIRLEISNVARRSLVRINTNEEIKLNPLVTQNAVNAGPRATNSTKSDTRRRARNARVRAARAARSGIGGTTAVQTTTVVSTSQVTDLVRKMAPGSPNERPLQRLTMEGSFAGITRFLQGLDEMNLMVTVVEMQLTVAPQAPPPGYNQRLTATMILAL